MPIILVYEKKWSPFLELNSIIITILPNVNLLNVNLFLYVYVKTYTILSFIINWKFTQEIIILETEHLIDLRF